MSLSNSQMRIIHEALIKQGETELAKRFEVEPSIKQMKQMVIRSIQEGEPDKELIQSYLQRLEVEKKLSRKEGRDSPLSFKRASLD